MRLQNEIYDVVPHLNPEIYLKCAAKLQNLSFVAQIETVKTLLGIFSQMVQKQREIKTLEAQEQLFHSLLLLKEWASSQSRTRPKNIPYDAALSEQINACFLACCN